MRLKFGILIFSWFGLYYAGYGQFSGFNLAEYQLGNIPGEQQANVNSIYNQFNLDYKWNGFRASTRLESFYSTDTLRTHYTKLNQYSLAYRKKGLDIKAGHFYETLGKGLLFRGYEIKNSVYENIIYRTKQGFYRDTRGLAASYSNKFLQVKALRGKSLQNELPATSPDNRVDLVSAGELNFTVAGQTLGGIYLNNINPADTANYTSFHLGGSFIEGLDYYGELAYRMNGGNNFWSFSKDDSFGGYLSLSYSLPGFGLSFEYKNYQDLFIGSGISDPPTLVKEHIYRLLNRSTHIPFYFDESGIQLEVFYVPAENHLITINHSRSKNEVGETVFKAAEYFADWQFTVRDLNEIKVFLDYSFDEIWSEKNRFAGGFYFTRKLESNWSASLETEFQQLEKSYLEGEKFHNLYSGLVFSKSSKFSASLIWEFTTDERFADNPGTNKIETKQHYPGVNILYRPHRKHTLQLFAGKRRGGPACTAGICYEILDFKGLEIRYAVKF